MNNQWDGWLRELQLSKKGGVRLKRVFRGLAFSHSVSIPGDFSAATFRGQVRASPDADGASLADFSFTSPSYDAPSGRTLVTYSLASGDGANSTGSLAGDEDADGVEFFPFDIFVTPSGGDEEMFFGGILPLVGTVTQ